MKEEVFARALSSAGEASAITLLIAAMALGKLAGDAPNSDTASARSERASAVPGLTLADPDPDPDSNADVSSEVICVFKAVAAAVTVLGVAVNAACTLLAPSGDSAGVDMPGTGLTGIAPAVKDAACPLIAVVSAATVLELELIPADVDVVASTASGCGSKVTPLAPEPVVVTPAGSMPAFAC